MAKGLFWDDGYYKLDEIILDTYEDLYEAFGVQIPIPFHRGDLVKSVYFCKPTSYGVVYGSGLPRDSQEEDKEWWEWRDGAMGIRLDISWDEGKFGWDHDFPILSLSYCEGKEVPHDNRMVRLLSYLRKGRLDVIDVLLEMHLGDLDSLLALFKD